MKHIILIILLTLGGWAQEIGVPYVNTKNVVVAQSAALSHDEETFYTYANNTLTHWSLNPVKVLDSVKIDDPDFMSTNSTWIVVTPDKQKIIFAKHGKLIGLFDLSIKKFIKKEYIKCYLADSVGGYIITVDRDRTITQWDGRNLSIIKRVQLPKLIPSSCNECHDLPLVLLKSLDEKTIIISTGIRIIAIDFSTFKIINEELLNDKDFYISLDRKMIVDMYESYSLPALQRNPFFEYKNIENNPFYIRSRDAFRINPSSELFSLEYNRKDGSYTFYVRKSHKQLATLYQFQDQNWILITPGGYFDASTNAGEYLAMKNSKGLSLGRIGEIAYKKYNKLINLKDQ